MDQSIERKQAELNKQATEAEKLKALSALFPDLKVHTNRWNTQRYTSAQANALCTKYDLAHNCGCCPDSPLELWPYMEIDGMRIYADGIPFTIGERGYGLSERPDAGWQEYLRSKKIPEAIITDIEKYFEEHSEKESSYEDEE